MAVLEGRISWSRFLQVHLPAFCWLAGSILLGVWSLYFDFRSQFIVAGFSLIVSVGSLLYLLIALSISITWFRLEGDTLWFSQLGRFSRCIPLERIVSIERTSSPNEDLIVYLRGGSSLFFAGGTLEHVAELSDVIIVRIAKSEVPLEGCLNRASVAYTVVTQTVLACLLIPVGILGWFIMAVPFHPAKLGDPRAFLTLGILIQGLVLTGLYYLVLKTWIGCVRWYQTTPQGFAYRTVFSRSETQKLWSDIASYTVHRPKSQRGSEPTYGVVRFQDGSRIKLHLGMLHNVVPLVDQIKRQLTTPSRSKAQVTLPAIDEDHPRWAKISPHRQPDETILWIGTADFRKVRSEAYAECAFGILLIALGFGVAALLVFLAVRFGDFAPLFIACVFSVFGLIGAWSARAPWVINRLLSQSTYVVTDRRLMVLDGLNWSDGHCEQKIREPVVSYLPEIVRGYEIDRDRHISLGGYWQKGRKRSQHWVHQGIFAPADLQGAEQALGALLSRSADWCPGELEGELETL